MAWTPDITTQQTIAEFLKQWHAVLPYILGIDEFIEGCTIQNMDPYAVGSFPRYISVALRGDYHQDVFYRGGLGVGVGDDVVVVHLRDGDRYEVITVGGSTGTPGFPDPNARGDILYGDATPAWALRAIGASASVLYSDGNDPQWGNGFQPLWTNRHDFNLGIRFSNAVIENEIIFPLNMDQALRFVDWTTGFQFLTFDSNGQMRIIVNRNNADIDFEVDSDNVNALLQVDAANDVVNVQGLANIEGIQMGIVGKGAAYTATTTDHTIIVTCVAANITITLPAAAGVTGQIYNIKKVDATAFTVIVDGNAAETIDGALTQTLVAQYDCITVQCDGTQWWII